MTKRFLNSLLVAACCLLAWAGQAMALPSLNHPERRWVVMETPHFRVHYYQGEQRTANRVATFAEEAYGKVTADLDARPGEKVPLILSEDEFFNGFAEPVKNRIVLDPRLAYSSAIGTRRFITHELTHIIHFEALNSGLPISKLINSAPFPAWFFEGLAQYEAEYWYPTFDRLLRLHAWEGNMLTPSERDAFTILGGMAGSQGYNEGYSWVKYVQETYGRDKIARFLAAGRAGNLSFRSIVEQVLGVNYFQLEAAWRQHLMETYARQISRHQAVVPGAAAVVPQTKRELNTLPRLSPDGKKLAYLSSKGREAYLEIRGVSLGNLALYLAEPDGSKPDRLIARGVTDYVWSPDGKRIAYSQLSQDKNFTDSIDLFVIDLKSKKSIRFTNGAYVTGVAWSPDGGRLAIATLRDEVGRIETGPAVAAEKDAKFTPLVTAADARQFAQLAWSPDGKWIAAGTFQPGNGQRLLLVGPDDARLVPLTGGSIMISDTRPAWSPDSQWLYFISTRDQFMNLFRISVDGKQTERLTDTYTGLEGPFLAGEDVWFSQYAAVGAAIQRVPRAKLRPVAEAADPPDPPPAVVAPGAEVVAARPLYPVESYHAWPTPDLIQPFTGTDEQGDLLGISATFSDILNKHEMGGLIAYGLSSQRISYLLGYNNYMLTPAFSIALYDRPGFDVTRTRSVPYLERSQGGTASIIYQFSERELMGLGFTANYISSLSSAASLGVPATDLREGWRNQITFVYTNRSVSPSSDAHINPQNGYLTRLILARGEPRLGSAFGYNQAVAEIRRYIGVGETKHTFAFRLMGGVTTGEGVPFLLGGDKGNIAVGTTELLPLRGYNIAAFPSQSGNRFFLGSAEWRFPINTHIDASLGTIYLDRMYGALFFDVGRAWFDGRRELDVPTSNYPGLLASVGGEVRLSTAIIGKFPFYILLGAAKPLRPLNQPVRIYFGFQNVF